MQAYYYGSANLNENKNNNKMLLNTTLVIALLGK